MRKLVLQVLGLAAFTVVGIFGSSPAKATEPLFWRCVAATAALPQGGDCPVSSTYPMPVTGGGGGGGAITAPLGPTTAAAAAVAVVPSTSANIAKETGGNLDAILTGVTGSIPTGNNVIGHIICDSGCSGAAGIAQDSVTAGQTGGLNMGAVTTSAPSYTSTHTNMLSLDTSGNLRTLVGGSLPAGSALLGKVGIDQTTPGTTNAIQVIGSLPAGSAVIGKTAVDQTTPGTSNAISLAQVGPGTTILTGTGAVGAGSQRVAVGTDTATIAGSAPGTAGSASANVLTVQGVASMTKLLVTPDSVALPANQSVNTAQVNGVNTLTGTGAVGTGSQRVAVGTDTATIAGSAPSTVLLANTTSPYPSTAVPITASATGTTGATTATLTAVNGHTTYLCGFSIRANATAAATGNATVTGTISNTLNFTQWTAPNASGLGINEQVMTPCVPASAVSTNIAVISAAPGTGGVVSVTAWGYSI